MNLTCWDGWRLKPCINFPTRAHREVAPTNKIYNTLTILKCLILKQEDC